MRARSYMAVVGLAAVTGAGCRPTAVPTRGAAPFAAYQGASVEEVRDVFTATAVRPTSDVRWIEATVLDPVVVRKQSEEEGRLLGLPGPEARARTRRAVEEATDDRTTIEVWMAATCERCLDLEEWGFALRGPGGEVSRPRWVDSMIVDSREHTVTVLDVHRAVTLSWVRAALVFRARVIPDEGTVTLLASRPEGWDRPLELEWRFASPEKVGGLLTP